MFEYKFITISPGSAVIICLNEEGKERWELAHLFEEPRATQYKAILKRKKKASKGGFLNYGKDSETEET